eukprot:scaffold27148_cov36-Phaeocystis_antarctica.AAC.1
MAKGESRGSRGVMGGVGHVRGVESTEPGQLRGVSSLATERASPATLGLGEERRDREERRFFSSFFCCSTQNSLKSTTPLWLRSAAANICFSFC